MPLRPAYLATLTACLVAIALTLWLSNPPKHDPPPTFELGPTSLGEVKDPASLSYALSVVTQEPSPQKTLSSEQVEDFERKLEAIDLTEHETELTRLLQGDPIGESLSRLLILEKRLALVPDQASIEERYRQELREHAVQSIRQIEDALKRLPPERFPRERLSLIALATALGENDARAKEAAQELLSGLRGLLTP